MSIIFKPTAEIVEVCDLVDHSISTFLEFPDRIPSGESE
jgi:hypothetical protein